MSFSENKKIILKSSEAFLKLQIVDCGSKLSCPQDKTVVFKLFGSRHPERDQNFFAAHPSKFR